MIVSSADISVTIVEENYDIQKDRYNIAYLIIGGELRIFFNTNEDLAAFVNIVGELEIANDTFQADKEDRE